MDQPVRRRQRRRNRGAGDHPPLAVARGKFAGEPFGPRRIGVENAEPADAEPQRRVCDRRAGAAGTDLHGAIQRGTGKAAPERFGKTPPVGVVADAPPIAQQHRVDGADHARVVGQRVEQRDYFLLARIRDVQPGEAHALGRGNQLRQRANAEAEPLQVDQPVNGGKTLRRALALVHRGREGALDAGADQPGKQGGSLAIDQVP